MDHLLLPMLIFFAIELVAYTQGLSAFVTIATAGAAACWGMQLGSRAWERAKRKKEARMFDKDVMAANLRAGRARLRLSQKQAAAKIGVSEASIVNYENGTSSPSYETAWSLADLYGVTLDELGGRKAPAA